MIVTMDAKHRLAVPLSQAAARPGDEFHVSYDAEEDAIIFRRSTTGQDWLEILAECPIPIDDP
ncbi:hypothetical protein OKA04_07185 [Luteolibacter flavescens]|uniref:AbrB/MazE/SpoVT family DNA-binding domain-containing protein n=1 Tax=Luteolibacter flavescens TaxID=1859460 RepID=A0ABT3FLQ5_9BACT|nr:hypothetical protein [Luteolibacter flavescens]MCW1884510.1 hypothetical protein [Luteolibacter flavescens]